MSGACLDVDPNKTIGTVSRFWDPCCVDHCTMGFLKNFFILLPNWPLYSRNECRRLHLILLEFWFEIRCFCDYFVAGKVILLSELQWLTNNFRILIFPQYDFVDYCRFVRVLPVAFRPETPMDRTLNNIFYAGVVCSCGCSKLLPFLFVFGTINTRFLLVRHHRLSYIGELVSHLFFH